MAVDGNESISTFLIIGTYYDKMEGLRWPFQESIKTHIYKIKHI